MRLLLEKGAKANVADDNGFTPLHIAAAQGLTSLMRVLLEKGANVDAGNYAGATPLHCAAKNGYGDLPDQLPPYEVCVRLLLEKGAKADVPNSDGKTPLDLASAESIKQLLRPSPKAQKKPGMLCGCC